MQETQRDSRWRQLLACVWSPVLKRGLRQLTEVSSSPGLRNSSASVEPEQGAIVGRFNDATAGLADLKILHILDHSLPLHSGYTIRTQSILQQQRRREWVPVALTSPKHEANWKGTSEQCEEIGGFRFYRTGPLLGGKVPLTGEVRLMRALARRIEEVAQIEKPALLHAHSPV